MLCSRILSLWRNMRRSVCERNRFYDKLRVAKNMPKYKENSIFNLSDSKYSKTHSLCMNVELWSWNSMSLLTLQPASAFTESQIFSLWLRQYQYRFYISSAPLVSVSCYSSKSSVDNRIQSGLHL